MTIPLDDDEAKRMAEVTAGVSIREGIKHLLIGMRILEGLGHRVVWYREVVHVLADLSHELDHAITPYPEVV